MTRSARRIPDADRSSSAPPPGLPPAVDAVAAALGLVVLSPLLLAIAGLVRCTSPGPALFRQVRIGLDEQPFTMLKFRTMYVDSDDRPHREYVGRLLAGGDAADLRTKGVYKLVDDPRTTPLGRWLRRTSLDELPQLINVLRGEMSLVGPRPVLPWEAAQFKLHHRRRFAVRPGITGLWQTSGRNEMTMVQALDLDVRYVEGRSVRLDCAILLRTPGVVLRRRGVR